LRRRLAFRRGLLGRRRMLLRGRLLALRMSDRRRALLLHCLRRSFLTLLRRSLSRLRLRSLMLRYCRVFRCNLRRSLLMHRLLWLRFLPLRCGLSMLLWRLPFGGGLDMLLRLWTHGLLYGRRTMLGHRLLLLCRRLGALLRCLLLRCRLRTRRLLHGC
jgi:hypothetical protein